jgi:SAM-dependent methyltransferase
MRAREAWERNAEAWIAWAREPGHDHYFTDFLRPRLLELLPPPLGLSLDIGCGEGRFTRELRRAGYRVIGVDSSPTLLAAARANDPQTEFVEADAASLPFADATAELIVACMSLLNVDELDSVVAEVARLLLPGGRFCFANLHPSTTFAYLRERDPDASYGAERGYTATARRGGLEMTFHDIHRPLEAYGQALERAGLLIEAVREPLPTDEHVAVHPGVARWLRRPRFLLVRAIRPPARTPGSAA